MNRPLAALLTAALMSTYASRPAMADFDSGLKAYMASDFTTAINEFNTSEAGTDGQAKFILGLMYLGGMSTNRDLGAAENAFSLAFQLGFTPSIFGELFVVISGLKYVKNMEDDILGKGFQTRLDSSMADLETILPQLQQAVPWVIVAANAGAPEARLAASLIESGGLKGEKNPEAAARWLDGLAPSLSPGWNYLLGKEYSGASLMWMLPRDTSLALTHYTAAAEGGLLDAQLLLGQAYLEGKLKKFMGHTDIDVDLEASLRWYLAAAEQGDADAQYQVGKFYTGSIDRVGAVPRDSPEAQRWFLLSANQGNAEAMYLLYILSLGVDKGWLQKAFEAGHPASTSLYVSMNRSDFSDEEAFSLLLSAAEKGDKVAQFQVGHMLYQGEGTTQDRSAAAGWYRRSAEQGVVGAQYEYGRVLHGGIGIAQDHVNAVRWLGMAADAGDTKAELALGFAYFRGEGVKKDFEQAAALARPEALKGNGRAQVLLSAALINIDRSAWVEALAWYTIAVRNGGPGATADHQARIERELSAGQRVQARNFAEQCLASKYAQCEMR